MDINSCFPSNYIKASDLGNHDHTLEIASVEMQDVSGQDEPEEDKPVVYFKDRKKGLVLNVTNKNTIVGIHGPETDNWIGKSITLFATQTDFKGKSVPCIRVRIQRATPTPMAASSPPRQQHTELSESDIPFVWSLLLLTAWLFTL